jgi:hypothetical protein
MTDKNSNSRPEPSADPLSATAMFLKAFDTDREEAPKGADRLAAEPQPTSAGAVPEAPAVPPPSQSGPEPGEFTQMFSSMGQRPPAPQPSTRREAPPVSSEAARESQVQPEQGPGEFTRIFVSGKAAPYAPPARASEPPSRPAPPSPGPSKSKGFSSPGASDSASAEGTFTQLFRNPPRPAAPAPATPPSASPDSSWKNDAFFRPAETSVPQEASPSVTSILSSLAGPGTAHPRTPEAAAYRPEPLPSYAPPKPAEEPGGVTRLIQRLAQEPGPGAPTSAGPGPSAPPPPPGSGPGEFTRIISGLGPLSAAAPPAAAPAPSGGAAPAFAIPAAPLPPASKLAPPPLPAAPMPHAAQPAAPASFAVPPVPAIPKPAPPPVPAIAPPKSKLEAMVPILLVINTFLLVLLLVVVIFLIKAK